MAGSEAGGLRRELGLIDVFAVALGTTLSAGFFLLPGLAAAQAGAAVPIAYALGLIPFIPAIFSIIELATAMPKAGGTYYFLDRSLGPAVGAIGGLGTWLALVLKTALALIGMGAYLALLVPEAPILGVAVVAALVLAGLNAVGTREATRVQRVLVFALLAILAWFLVAGGAQIDPARLTDFSGVETAGVLATTGLVYVSYVGIPKVASLAEEVADPERNLPRGMLLALAVVAVVYVFGSMVMVGVVPLADLAGDLTPVGTAARAIAGRPGVWVMSGAAVLASLSLATAALMSAARFPLAMARDGLVPAWLAGVDARGTPLGALLATTVAIVAVLVLLDVAFIAKLAGAFQLLIFALLNLAVIVMRESQIPSYDPGFRSPLYPWMQGVGLLAPVVLIDALGFAPSMFLVGLLAAGYAWYFAYARSHVARAGAIFHVFERLGRMRFDALDVELRSILKEKGLRQGDRFEDVVAMASVFDLAPDATLEQAVARASRELARRCGQAPGDLARQFLDGTRTGATPVDRGVAIPHLRLDGLETPLLVVARATEGIRIASADLPAGVAPDPVFAIFFLASPMANPGQHLRFLAQLAVRAEGARFLASWRAAAGAEALKELLLRDESMADVTLQPDGAGADWIGRALRDVEIPGGCLVVAIRRAGELVIPHGNTVLEAGDHLTILGGIEEVRTLRARLGV